jgi:hypothetical protein
MSPIWSLLLARLWFIGSCLHLCANLVVVSSSLYNVGKSWGRVTVTVTELESNMSFAS